MKRSRQDHNQRYITGYFEPHNKLEIKSLKDLQDAFKEKLSNIKSEEKPLLLLQKHLRYFNVFEKVIPFSIFYHSQLHDTIYIIQWLLCKSICSINKLLTNGLSRCSCSDHLELDHLKHNIRKCYDCFQSWIPKEGIRTHECIASGKIIKYRYGKRCLIIDKKDITPHKEGEDKIDFRLVSCIIQ